MYLHRPTLLRALRATFSREHFHPTHAGWTLLLTASFLILRGTVLVFRGLDHLLFPSFRYCEVRSPVYIVGNPRSGTTFLHQLISLDRRFTTMRLIDAILPAISLQRILRSVGRIEGSIGRPLQRFVLGLSTRVFSGWEEIHRTRLLEPEEDEQLLVYSLLTPVILLLFPFFAELGDINYVDRMKPGVRWRLMNYYVGSLRRHLYEHDPHHDGRPVERYTYSDVRYNLAVDPELLRP